MNKGLWYDQPADAFATSLRWQAARADESAARKREERRAFSAGDAEMHDRAAKRLRAMAKLCDIALPGTRAGDIDFRGLNRPDLGHQVEDRIIAEIEAATVIPNFDYRLHADPPLVLVTDRSSDRGGMTVTNNAEGVIAMLAQHIPDLARRRVICCDTDGIWDVFQHRDGVFVGFQLIGARSEEAAISEARRLTEHRL